MGLIRNSTAAPASPVYEALRGTSLSPVRRDQFSRTTQNENSRDGDRWEMIGKDEYLLQNTAVAALISAMDFTGRDIHSTSHGKWQTGGILVIEAPLL